MDKFRKKNEKPREREAAPEGELCWGRNPVISLLEESPERCMKVLVSETMQPHVKTKIISLCREAGVVFQNAGQAALDRLTNGENHQGVAAYLTQAKLWDADELLEKLPAAPEPVMILLCDHVQDPHNLGAIIRSAECFGAHGVIISKRRASGLTSSVAKAAGGALNYIPVVRVTNLSSAVEEIKKLGVWVYCCDMDGDRAYAMGLLHDIGRREGVMDMKHIICGYRFMKAMGYVDIARICLTHSFPYKNIKSYNGKNDCSEEETIFIKDFLEQREYDDYDRLIQLCDAVSFQRVLLI